MTAAAQPSGEGRTGQAMLPVVALSALGVVFGDIGTSPLYTLKTVLDLAGEHADRTTILGVLSLIVWTLIIITSVKYVDGRDAHRQ